MNAALVLILIAVWGWILHSVFDKPADAVDSMVSVHSTPEASMNGSEENYTLLLNYADPFLKNATKPSQQRSIAKKNPPQNTPKPKPAKRTRVPWPEVQYFGVVKNPNRGMQLGLISINKQSHLLEKSITIGDLQIRTFNSDSVIVALNDEVKSFKTALPN